MKIISLNRPLFFTCIVAAILSCVAVVAMMYVLFVGDNKQYLVDEIEQLSRVVSANSVQYISTDDPEKLQDRLKNFAVYSKVIDVTIYKYQELTNNVTFFAGYQTLNRVFPSKTIEEMDTSSKIEFVNHTVRLVQAINDGNKLIGYVEIKLSAESLYDARNTIILIGIIMFTFTLFLCVFFFRYFYQMLRRSMVPLLDTVQQITKQKNYQLRNPKIKWQEFDVLARSMNIMLARTQKHIDEQKNSEQELLTLNKELQSKVDSRTAALKESNQELLVTLEELHQFQGQLVENQKMASLGDMVAGIAHEINTPIGLGITASSLLSDRFTEIKNAYDNKVLKGSELNKFLIDSEANISIITRNLTRTADLIASFKEVAVAKTVDDYRELKIKDIIDDVLKTLSPELTPAEHYVHVDCDEEITLYGQPTALNQVLINLIMNSKIHGFDKQENGDIYITVSSSQDYINITYRDNGKGINEDIKGKLFEPFFTTKRGDGGSGLGLHLVYNLVTQGLGGKIQVESNIVKGVCFIIDIPRNIN
jgi:signal transduction histidine kinase